MRKKRAHAREGRAPAAAKDVPRADVEVLAEALHVGDEGPRGVVLEAGVRRAAARPALVKEDNAEKGRVKVAAVAR